MKVNEYYTMQQIEKMFCLCLNTRIRIFCFQRFDKLLKTVKIPRIGAYGQKCYHRTKVLPKENLIKFKLLLKDFQKGKYYKDCLFI